MNKRILISVSVLAILVLYLVVTRVKWSSEVPDLPQWEGRAEEIVINRPGGTTIKLFKKDGKWVVNDQAYPADERAVDEIDNQLKKLHLTDLISKKGFYNKYELTPDKYSEVIIKKGGAIFRKFKFGKKSSTGQHTFVRIDDRPDIFLAEGTFDLILSKSLDDFRNKEILSIKRDSITGLTIEYKGNKFDLSKVVDRKAEEKDAKKEDKKARQLVREKWVCKGYESVNIDTTRMESICASLDPLRGSSFLNEPKETLTQSICTIQIRSSQKNMTLSIYKKDNKFVAIASDNPYVFVIENWTAENFFVTGIDKLKAAGGKP